MSTFVLIHGAWHGAWCWYKVVPLLKRAGRNVIAPDLPSLGRDTTPLDQVSLDSWIEHLSQIIEAQPSPVVLVGHSRGGILLSALAERLPKRISHLVYVTALLLKDGETIGQVLVEDGTSLIIPNRVPSSDGLSSTVKDEALSETFYASCPEEDITLAKMLLKPEPRGPGATPMHVSDANFGSVPRTYVECLRDRAIPLSLQRRMQAALPCQQVWSIDTDHSPFFSSPQRLAELLLAVPEGSANAA